MLQELVDLDPEYMGLEEPDIDYEFLTEDPENIVGGPDDILKDDILDPEMIDWSIEGPVLDPLEELEP